MVARVSLHNVLSKISTYFNLAIVIVSTHYFMSNLCHGTNSKCELQGGLWTVFNV